MMTTDLQSKNTTIDLTPWKPGQPRLYTEEEMKEQKRERLGNITKRTERSVILTIRCINFVPRE